MPIYQLIVSGDPDKAIKVFVASLDEKFEKFAWKLKEGRGIDEREWRDIPVFYSVQEGMRETFLANGSMCLIISNKGKKIIEQRIKGFEFLPIKVFDSEKMLLENYQYVANITNTVKCLDYQKSKYMTFDEKWGERQGRISGIIKTVVKEEMIPQNLDVFRIQEFKQKILVSQRFVKIYRENNFSGLDFTKILTS